MLAALGSTGTNAVRVGWQEAVRVPSPSTLAWEALKVTERRTVTEGQTVTRCCCCFSVVPRQLPSVLAETDQGYGVGSARELLIIGNSD